MIITRVAAAMPGQIRHLVYLDAELPDPVQSLFDLFTSAGSDPLSFIGLEPAKAYIEKIEYDPRNLEDVPKTYVLCTKSEFSIMTRIAERKIAANKKG